MTYGPEDIARHKATICDRISNGESLRGICDDEDMPAASTVFLWLSADETFSEQYARAREAQADAVFDDILTIADDGRNDWMERKNADGQNIGWMENGEALRRSQLRIEARKWMAGKLKPKKYGDKLDLNHGGKIDADITHHGEIAVSATADFVAQSLGARTDAAPTEPRQD
jgi:hypothetical protein